MTESSAAAARMERRRKILQNPEARLAKITGRPVPPSSIPASNICPSIEEDVLSDYLTSTREENVTNQFDSFLEAKVEPTESSFVKKLLDTRLHIFLYAILVNVIFISNNVTDTYVFLPLLLWEFVEFFYFQAQEKKVSLTLRFVTGVAPEVMDSGWAILKRTMTFTQDACLYIFTIILMHLFLNYFNFNR